MHITFAGTPKFSKIVLENLLSETSIDAVVTAKDKKKGRGLKKKASPVKKIAQSKQIAVFHDLNEIIEKTDLVLVAAYGRIISEKNLKKPKMGFLNVHPSLLPKYRGPSPIQGAILNGEEETGVSIMLMDQKIDHGPILKQKKIKLDQTEYYKDLEEKLACLGGKLLSKTVKEWTTGKIKSQEQNHSQATYTKLFKKSDGKVNWKDSAVQIEREIRAYNPWPGSYSKLDNKMIKFFKAEVQKQTKNGPFGEPGKIYLGTNEKIAVQTGKDFLLIKELQKEGKKKTNSKNFLQGNIDIIGKTFH